MFKLSTAVLLLNTKNLLLRLTENLMYINGMFYSNYTKRVKYIEDVDKTDNNLSKDLLATDVDVLPVFDNKNDESLFISNK